MTIRNATLIRPSATFSRREKALGLVALLIAALSTGDAGATPPSLPPPHFHPFGPPTQLIPDGSVVPFRPIKPIAPMTPMFMMPVNPFGNLGQNFGALGGTLQIDQRQQSAHRRTIQPPAPKSGGAGRGATSKNGTAAATAPIGSSNVPAHRRALGW